MTRLERELLTRIKARLDALDPGAAEKLAALLEAAEGAMRQELLEHLYRWYTKNGCGDDFTDEKWPGQENGYWKNRLRTASTERLEKIYQEKFGGTPCMQ